MAALQALGSLNVCGLQARACLVPIACYKNLHSSGGVPELGFRVKGHHQKSHIRTGPARKRYQKVL